MTDPYEAREPTLGSYLALLRRRKWWVIAVTVLGLVASLGYSLTQPKAYSASAQLLFQPENAGVTASREPATDHLDRRTHRTAAGDQRPGQGGGRPAAGQRSQRQRGRGGPDEHHLGDRHRGQPGRGRVDRQRLCDCLRHLPAIGHHQQPGCGRNAAQPADRLDRRPSQVAPVEPGVGRPGERTA